MADTSHDPACVFCRIVRGELPAARVHEDEATLAFMDLGQVNPGHVLVALKRHAPMLTDLTPDEAAQVMRSAHRVALAQRRSFDAPGLTLLQANGAAGDQTVFHFHLHLLPRHVDDGVALAWPRKNPSSADLEGYAQRLREAIAALGG